MSLSGSRSCNDNTKCSQLGSLRFSSWFQMACRFVRSFHLIFISFSFSLIPGAEFSQCSHVFACRLQQCGLHQTARLLPSHVVQAGAVAGELKLYSFDTPAVPHASATLSAYGIPLGIPVHAALGDAQCSFSCLQQRSDAGGLLLDA